MPETKIEKRNITLTKREQVKRIVTNNYIIIGYL